MRNRNHSMWRLISGLLAVAVFTSFGIQENAQAQDNPHHREDHERGSRRPRREGPSPFVMGLCIGQTAAQQGVTLPMPEAGKPPTLDETQKAALHSAAESCRAQLTGQALPQPTPTAPTALPSTPGVPTVTVSPTLSPSVSPSVIASP